MLGPHTRQPDHKWGHMAFWGEGNRARLAGSSADKQPGLERLEPVLWGCSHIFSPSPSPFFVPDATPT